MSFLAGAILEIYVVADAKAACMCHPESLHSGLCTRITISATGGLQTPRMADGEAEMYGLAWQPEGGLDLGHVLGLTELLPAVPRWDQDGCASLQDGSSEPALETLKCFAVCPVPILIGAPGPSKQDQGR